MVESAPLLEVKNLEVQFKTYHGIAKAVNGVSFHVDPGETLAIVGESGSSKSVTSLTIVGDQLTDRGRPVGLRACRARLIGESARCSIS